MAVSSSKRPAGSRKPAHLATWAAVVRFPSRSRCSTGAQTMSALSSLIAAVRAVWAPRRVVTSVRSASRSPRARGIAKSARPSTSRAARRASSASVLAPSPVAAVRGWPNSITHSPTAPRCAHRPCSSLSASQASRSRGCASKMACVSLLSVVWGAPEGVRCDNTVMSHTTRVDRLLIRSAATHRTGVGGNGGQIQHKTRQSRSVPSRVTTPPPTPVWHPFRECSTYSQCLRCGRWRGVRRRADAQQCQARIWGMWASSVLTMRWNSGRSPVW